MISKMILFLEKLKPNRFKEIINYSLWGTVTGILGIGSFQLLCFFGLDYRVSNIISLVLTKFAAYLVNKHFVFHTRCDTFIELTNEVLRYIMTRGFTMLLDFFLLIALTEIFGIDPNIGKFCCALIVIIINYFLGKFVVYK